MSEDKRESRQGLLTRANLVNVKKNDHLSLSEAVHLMNFLGSDVAGSVARKKLISYEENHSGNWIEDAEKEGIAVSCAEIQYIEAYRTLEKIGYSIGRSERRYIG